MTIQNSEDNVPQSMFILNQEVQGIVNENELTTLIFNGYNGGNVNLSDYGIEYPVYYDIFSMQVKPTKTPILLNHRYPVGHTTEITKTTNNSALGGKGVASYPGEKTTEVVTALKNGFPFQGSMGVDVENIKRDFVFTPKGVTKIVNNVSRTGPFFTVMNSILKEMTVVIFGRDGSTNFQTLSKEDLMTIKNSAGEIPTPEEKKKIEVAPVAPVVPPVTPVVTEDTTINNSVSRNDMANFLNMFINLEDKQEKISAIKNFNNGHDPETIQRDINSQRYLNSLPGMPKQDDPNKDIDKANLITARFAVQCGIKPETIKNAFGDKIADIANSKPAGFIETLVHVANSTGGKFDGFDNIEQVCKHIKDVQFNGGARINNAGFSVIDMPNLLEKVTTMMMEERWALDAPISMSLCKLEDNKDFRKTQRIRPTTGEMWKHLDQTGKIELTTFGTEKQYQTQLDTSAQIAVFDRPTIVNDDTNVIQSMLDGMVEGAMMIPDFKLGKKMLVQASAAGTFWDTDNSFTGTPLNGTNLKTYYNTVRKYAETRGDKTWNNIISGRWTLITAMEQEDIVYNLLEQQYIVNNTTANTTTGSKNYWYRRMDSKTFANMENTGLLGAGTFVDVSTCILWPSDVRFAPYSMNFLQGKRQPTIESVPLPGNMLGTGVRGYWDVEVNERERTAVLRFKA